MVETDGNVNHDTMVQFGFISAFFGAVHYSSSLSTIVTWDTSKKTTNVKRGFKTSKIQKRIDSTSSASKWIRYYLRYIYIYICKIDSNKLPVTFPPQHLSPKKTLQLKTWKVTRAPRAVAMTWLGGNETMVEVVSAKGSWIVIFMWVFPKIVLPQNGWFNGKPY